jgi:hypothetical protein
MEEQWKWLSDYNDILRADWVKFENLEDNLNEFLEKNDIPKVKLQHVRPTKHKKHKDYRKYYDSVTYDIVAEKHKKDIELFGYKF